MPDPDDLHPRLARLAGIHTALLGLRLLLLLPLAGAGLALLLTSYGAGLRFTGITLASAALVGPVLQGAAVQAVRSRAPDARRTAGYASIGLVAVDAGPILAASSDGALGPDLLAVAVGAVVLLHGVGVLLAARAPDPTPAEGPAEGGAPGEPGDGDA